MSRLRKGKMKIQQEKFTREVFLSMLGEDGISSTALAARQYRGEVAVFAGLSRPLRQNEYGELDLYAAALTNLIKQFVNIEMKQAADLVREYWREWTYGLARSERLKGDRLDERAFTDGYCFVIATHPDDKSRIEV